MAIIKIYESKEETIGAAIHIIEGVSDVVVYESSYILAKDSPMHIGPMYTSTILEKFYNGKQDSVKFIDYTKDENRHRACVSFAYVCNDNGKTIERVEATDK